MVKMSIVYSISMSISKLPNYLKTYRKRSGLTQQEVANLLGAEDDDRVYRNETFAKIPTLEAALAYEVIFGVSVSQLFAGLHEEVLAKVHEQAVLLEKKLRSEPPARSTTRKLEFLRKAILATAVSSR